MDLSYILASPVLHKESKVKSKLEQMDKILNNINNYNTTKVDLEQLNKEAKLEAKKGFYEEIDGLQLIPNLPKIDQVDMFGFNKICSQINRGLKKVTIFKNRPYLVFKREDLYGDEAFSEKMVKEILLKNIDKLKMFKTSLKMISIESDLDKILAIKKVVIDEMVCVPIVDVYATLIKILINNGINLELLDRYVIKYQNIKDNASLKRNKAKEADSEDEDNLNIIQSFIHIVDLIEISVDSTKIFDHQILADYVSIILILFSEQEWRYNLQCLSSLSHLFAIILKRMNSSKTTIKILSKTIAKFFKANHSLYFDFIDFFPDNTNNLINLKFALCKISLSKYEIKIGHTKERVDSTFERLKELKSLNNEEIKLVVSFVNHFFRTRELSDELSQQISDCLSSFVKDYGFEEENRNSIEFIDYMDSLIEQYSRKPKATPKKRKRVKGEHEAQARKVMINEKEVKKIWDQIELDYDED